MSRTTLIWISTWFDYFKCFCKKTQFGQEQNIYSSSSGGLNLREKVLENHRNCPCNKLFIRRFLSHQTMKKEKVNHLGENCTHGTTWCQNNGVTNGYSENNNKLHFSLSMCFQKASENDFRINSGVM